MLFRSVQLLAAGLLGAIAQESSGCTGENVVGWSGNCWYLDGADGACMRGFMNVRVCDYCTPGLQTITLQDMDSLIALFSGATYLTTATRCNCVLQSEYRIDVKTVSGDVEIFNGTGRTGTGCNVNYECGCGCPTGSDQSRNPSAHQLTLCRSAPSPPPPARSPRLPAPPGLPSGDGWRYYDTVAFYGAEHCFGRDKCVQGIDEYLIVLQGDCANSSFYSSWVDSAAPGDTIGIAFHDSWRTFMIIGAFHRASSCSATQNDQRKIYLEQPYRTQGEVPAYAGWFRRRGLITGTFALYFAAQQPPPDDVDESSPVAAIVIMVIMVVLAALVLAAVLIRRNAKLSASVSALIRRKRPTGGVTLSAGAPSAAIVTTEKPTAQLVVKNAESEAADSEAASDGGDVRDDPIASIAHLKVLLDAGAISDDDFEEKKRELLQRV